MALLKLGRCFLNEPLRPWVYVDVTESEKHREIDLVADAQKVLLNSM